MTKTVDITAIHGWYRFTRTLFDVEVPDIATLDGKILEWTVWRRNANNTIEYVIHVHPTSSGNHALIALTEDDYDLAEPGNYRHELWNRTDEVLIMAGKATLLEANHEHAHILGKTILSGAGSLTLDGLVIP